MYQKIKMICEQQGISISSLEKELGFSNGSISKWGVSMPRADSAVKIAAYLGVPISFLLGQEDEEKE